MFFRVFTLLGLLGLTQASTNVSGVLLDNTVWSNSGSANPYYLINDVQIPRNVTLTIQAGVIINFSQGDFEIFIKGVIKIQGTSAQPVIFQGGSADDLKYMINFQCAQLPNSVISYARFNGPKSGVRIENAPTYLQQNTGTLVIQSSTFTNNTQIASNTNAPNTNDSSIPALELRMCSLTQTGVSCLNSASGPIRLINSTIYYGTFYPRTSYQSTQVINSTVRNLTVIYDSDAGQFQLINSNVINATITSTGLPWNGAAFIVLQSVVRDMSFSGGQNLWSQGGAINSVFQNSSMFNISISYTSTMMFNPTIVSISGCKFTLGNIAVNYQTNPQITVEDSTLTKVNISTSDGNNGYGDTQNRGSLTISNTTLIDGAVNTPSLTATILYATITIIRPPLAISQNSIITVTGLTVSKSTIKNFAIGMQINAPNLNTVTISNSNFQSISQYLIDNQGPYDVSASNNYWGTNNGAVINNEMLDYGDDIHRGEVIYTGYASSPLSAEAECVPYGQVDPDTLSTTYWGIQTTNLPYG